MAIITYEDVVPTLIENTTMRKLLRDGVHQTYNITPVAGYVLHDSSYDYPEVDPETWEETGRVLLGYRTSTASVAANYDFTANPREFYAVPADSIPADQIFGGANNDHEVMSTQNREEV